MNYELAKKLKEAGFAQKQPTMVESFEIKGGTLNIVGEPVYTPTLSELIEACGDEFHQVNHWQLSDNRDWVAKGRSEKLNSGITGNGKTPEEAVANLWIKLNEI